MPVTPLHDSGPDNPDEVFAKASRPVTPDALVRSAGGISAPASSGAGAAPSPGGDAGATRASTESAVTTPSELAIKGKRTDLPEGFGFRLRIGLDGAGTSFIIERWSEAGVRTVATFS